MIPEPASTLDALYILDGGESHVEDISQWSPGVDVGKPRVFSGNVYVLRKADQWAIWDTGLDDELITEPDGKVFAHDVRGVLRRTLVSQLEELGLVPDDIDIIMLSHAHFDHVGNTRLFPRAHWYVQTAEYEAMFGPDFEKYGFLPDLYATLRDNEVTKLDGDHDLFGDGSAVILSTPGHTPGHQSLLVRLPRAGNVVLTGDVAHFKMNFDHRRVPAFNADQQQSIASMERLDAISKELPAYLWINHDAQLSATLKHSPTPAD